MKRTLRAATLATCLALFASTAAPQADAADLRIDWTAPASCPSASAVEERALLLLDGTVQSNVLAAVVVTQGARAYHAHIVLRGQSGVGERDIEDARCDVLAESVAVLIALSVPTPVSRDGGLALAIRPEVTLVWGSLPLVAAGLGAAVAIEGVASLRLELRGAYHASQSTTLPGTPLGAEFQLFTFGASLCRPWRFGHVQGGPCVGAEAHRVNARGFGGVVQLPGNTSWWGPSLRLFARVHIFRWLDIGVAVEVMVPVSRPQFVFEDVARQLHRVSVIALKASLGPEVRF
ncbi:MAG: hypothetical protein ABW321_23900 [Polyangiales bacterium]